MALQGNSESSLVSRVAADQGSSQGVVSLQLVRAREAGPKVETDSDILFVI